MKNDAKAGEANSFGIKTAPSPSFPSFSRTPRFVIPAKAEIRAEGALLQTNDRALRDRFRLSPE